MIGSGSGVDRVLVSSAIRSDFMDRHPADSARWWILAAMTSLLPQNPRIDAAARADKKRSLAS
jgi:hypothetical protein